MPVDRRSWSDFSSPILDDDESEEPTQRFVRRPSSHAFEGLSDLVSEVRMRAAERAEHIAEMARKVGK